MEKSILTKGNKVAILAIALTLLITTVGVSFAAFYTRTPQEGSDVIGTTCFDTEYTESSSMVNLAYSVPVSNEEGLASTPLSFTIKNKCDISEKYYVILNVKSSDGNASNLINPKYINVSLDGATQTFLHQYPEGSTVGYSNSKYNKSYVLTSGVLGKGQSASHQIRNWIDRNTTYSEVSGKSWNGKITIYTKVNTSSQSPIMPGVTELSKIDKIRLSAKPSTSLDYNVIGGSNQISSVKDDNFIKGEQTYIVDTTHQGYYITYADSYKFNIPTTTATCNNNSSYSLISPQVGKYSDIYGSLAGKYIVNYEGHNSSTAAYSTNRDRIYKVVSATATSITYISSSYTIEFPNNGITGVYTAEDDYGTSYYFRGNVTNNYVKFGKWTNEVYRGYISGQSGYREYFTKDECLKSSHINFRYYNMDCNKSPVAGKDMFWRIIRINGDGSLRLMYDGTEAHANGTRNYDRFALPIQQFNVKQDNNAYVGYMYGDINSSYYNLVHTNTNNSVIKVALEKWYEKNFVGTEYASKIGDMSFCNDRSRVAYNGTTGTGIGTTVTYYGAYERLKTNKRPSLICPQKDNDLFTSNKSTQGGNGKLTYPVGLLTADEIALGGGHENSCNRSYYLNKRYDYWLGSAYYYNGAASEFTVSDGGHLGGYNLINNFGAVPVINLSAEAANQLVGTGTMDDPYHF